MEPPDCTRYNRRLYNSNLWLSHAYSKSTLYDSELEVTVVYTYGVHKSPDFLMYLSRKRQTDPLRTFSTQ